MSGGLNIAALSRRTGVAPDTLRKWEQRYGVLRPARTKGGQRRYSELDVARVSWLQARLAEGLRIGEAAQLLGGEREAAASAPAELADAIFEAATRNEVSTLTRLIDQTLVLHPLEVALADVIQPVLERIGAGWSSGEVSVGDEHLASEAIRARLDGLLAHAHEGVRGTAVLACVPGERHDLGLLMLGVLLRADGWQIAYLGADTPLEETLRVAERVGARFVSLSVTLPELVRRLESALASLRVPRDVRLVLGGAAASPELARRLGARYADGDTGKTVRSFRKLAV